MMYSQENVLAQIALQLVCKEKLTAFWFEQEASSIMRHMDVHVKPAWHAFPHSPD